MEILLLKVIVFCFSMGMIMVGIAGCVLFIQYVNEFDSTISTIIYAGIFLIVIVTVVSNLSYMGIPYVVMYASLVTFIGYGNHVLKLLHLK